MKLLTRLFPMLLLFGTALVAWADEKTCTLASLEGGWGFALSGTLLAGPAAATGVLTVDEEGNFSGHDTLSANGTILSETFTGTVTVNPDCTTSATIVSSVVGEAHFDGVLVAKEERDSPHQKRFRHRSLRVRQKAVEAEHGEAKGGTADAEILALGLAILSGEREPM